MPLYFYYVQYCNKVIVKEFAKYGFTCKSDGIDQRDVVIADENVSLEAPQCLLEMDGKSVSFDSIFLHLHGYYKNDSFLPLRYLKRILISLC